ncbi:2,4-dihydroxyhept-2-ene-1,7-dioic acid aldolase [Hypericibacter adhaerens]|jgi:2-keto-3-deoxy-L-rhamnonate aldolase RhmA|uniref:2,4-dihydroxyhept-2-ene-1,7-dioic acid aldolase n=1 Tax=Hypericibacter adhaerens TaxID=2602016 RepID=A0A5J6MXQ6_9PROT|nr:aldolase/citrate lyase family protein [Hypericibacter adhaerens]QEX22522.1 2,4-dihydroxyhept-2-ene-1,7-dioic acid aldolase [Hypericibacter adhaerens]
MAITTDLVRRIRAGEPVVGSWFTVPHPMAAETLARGGFDFLLLDGEHAPVPPDALAGLLPATELQGCPVIYRPRTNSVDLIRGALDAGVTGVMVPMIETESQARAAIGAAKYPPLGRRGIGPWRASNYYDDYPGYVVTANEATGLVLQIESKEAVEAIDGIASLPGVDVLYVGPADMAGSMGLKPGEKHEALTAAIGRVAAAAKKHGKALGIDVTALDFLAGYREMGFSFFTYGIDTSYLMDGARAASQAFRARLDAKR